MNSNLLKKQNDLYENLNFIADIKKDDIGILKHFIASEKEAYEHDFQGQFYPSFHYEINRVMRTKMAKISEEDIFLAFYYRLKLGTIDKPLEKHFSLFLKAVERNIEDNDLDNTYLDGTDLYLLFGVKNNENSDAVGDIIYEDYIDLLKFISLCTSYTAYPNLRKKSARFLPFIANRVLMNRIKAGLSFYLDSKFTTAGSLVLLLLDTEKSSKDVLLALHKNKLENTEVWLLGSFYKDFQKTDLNKSVLKDLYDKFPKDWIDEYQSKKWD